MVVIECPDCQTRYRIDIARLGESGSLLKCSRCGRMFPPPSGQSSAAPPSRRPKRQKSTSDDNLTLPFTTPAWQRPPEPDDHEKTLEPDEAFTLGAAVAEPPPEDSLVIPDDDGPESDDLFDEEPEIAAPPLPLPTPAPRRRPPSFRAEPEPPPRAAASDDSERGKLWFLATFLVVVVIAYGLAYRILGAYPATADRMLADLPILGPLTAEKMLAQDVLMDEVTGKYSAIDNGRSRDVFLISGNALSTAAAPLHSVQVLGRIYDGEGNLLGEKSVYCGNAVSAEVANDLNPRQTSILQRIQPPRRFSLGPGDTQPFQIVFLNAPRTITRFTAEAVGAQR